MTTWQPAKFLIAMPGGPQERKGYIYRGLGLHGHSTKRSGSWTLTHLGSGHAVCFLAGNVSTAFPVATEIAEAGDWSFDGLSGWLNQFPDARERLAEIRDRHATVFLRIGGGGGDDGIARAITMSRA